MRRLATFIGLVAFGVIVFALYFSTAAQVTAPFLVSAMQISQRLNPELQFLSWCSAHSKKYQNDEVNSR